jgi:hypothetical protein
METPNFRERSLILPGEAPLKSLILSGESHPFWRVSSFLESLILF